MKITIVGGTGLIGAQLAPLLRITGHDVTIASTSTGVNALTGEGLDTALAGTDVVVDVLNTMDFATVASFFRTTTTNLLAAAAKAGVSHYVALGIVGAQKIAGNPYFDGKIAQEDLIVASGLPFTIARATQFFEFAETLALAATNDAEVHGSELLVQPASAVEVTRELAQIVTGAPHNEAVEIAGPERFTLSDFIGTWLEDSHDTRTLIREPGYTYFGTPVEETTLVPAAAARITTQTYSSWLTRSTTDSEELLA